MGARVIWTAAAVRNLREGLAQVDPKKYPAVKETYYLTIISPRSLEWLHNWKNTYVSSDVTYAQLLTKVYRERREHRVLGVAPWFISLLRQAMKNETGEGAKDEEEEAIKSPVFDVSRAEQLLNRIGAVAADTLECSEFSWYSRVKAGALIAEAIKLLSGE